MARQLQLEKSTAYWDWLIISLQPIKTRAELDSSTVFETNILRVSPVKDWRDLPEDPRFI